MKRLFLALVLGLLLAGCQGVKPVPHPKPADPANANPRDVSMNGIGLADPAPETYRILVVGHLYGSIEGSDPLPDQAVLDKVPVLKTSGMNMLVSLGDTVKSSSQQDFNELDRRLLRQLPFPVFNTPGNHDVGDRALYESRYGQTFYSFSYGPARLIFLDTVREDCAIDEEQMETVLRAALHAALADVNTKNILIFMHHTLFFKNDRLFELKNRIAQPNGWGCYGSHSFTEINRNIIQPTAAKKPIYLFAGDVGAWGNLTPYYERRSDLPITMVMTGLGDTSRDSGIVITVAGEKVSMGVYPFAGGEFPPLETFSPDYWVKQAERQ